MSETWEIMHLASTDGVSARIHTSEGLEDVAHIPKEWFGDGSRARLIAAAPDMLAALKAIANYMDWPGNKYPGCCPYGCDTPTIAKEALGLVEDSRNGVEAQP